MAKVRSELQILSSSLNRDAMFPVTFSGGRRNAAPLGGRGRLCGVTGWLRRADPALKGAFMPARHRIAALMAAAAGAITAFGLAAIPASAASMPYLSNFHTLTTLVSTVPRNGDVNPYGIFIIRHSVGAEHAGNILISNFNNSNNLQGTGSTIVQITPTGHRSLFALIDASALPGACPGGVGLTTALEVLPGGWVVVGSL